MTEPLTPEYLTPKAEAALREAEAQTTMLLSEIDRLRAENEALRARVEAAEKSGDEVYDKWQMAEQACDDWREDAERLAEALDKAMEALVDAYPEASVVDMANEARRLHDELREGGSGTSAVAGMTLLMETGGTLREGGDARGETRR